MGKFNTCFYDIESLDNVFTLANYKERENHIDLYIKCDNPDLMETHQNTTFYQMVLDRIYQRNHNFNGTLTIYDLENRTAGEHLAMTFGLSDSKLINDKEQESTYPNKFRIVCDTDENYDEDKHPYLVGYNSTNYDTTMLALFFHESFYVDPNRKATEPNYEYTYQAATAHQMRKFNDSLFASRFRDNMPIYLATPEHAFGPKTNYSDTRWRIRKNMLMTGRYIDASSLNEKQKKVALKRQLGMSGYQILESDKLGQTNNHIDDLDQLLDLIAYNVSDIVNLKEQFGQKLYEGQFTLKRQLLKTYPELVYAQKEGEYAPDQQPSKVRKDRLFIDSTSSQLAQKTLCPYGHLKDIPAVSFDYPHPDKAKELGIPVVNVLDEAKKFFYGLYSQPELRAQFDEIYDYYKDIEGKNFNESRTYMEDYGYNALTVSKISDIPKRKNCIPYFDANGQPTSCFATFSVGGVHGAEYNYELYHSDMTEWKQMKADIDYAKAQYPNPVEFRKTCGTKIKEYTLINGDVITVSRMKNALKHIATLTPTELTELTTTEKPKKPVEKLSKQLLQLYQPNELLQIQEELDAPTGLKMPDGRQLPVTYFLLGGRKVEESEYRNINDVQPQLFVISDKESWHLNPKYVFTSCCKANHEDFTSYYPNLLRMMKAFFNPGLGYDRYAEIFDQKQLYGKYMKDKTRPETERDYYAILREGTKLILNSASGAGDATFDNNIRMNNNIISMRIIGQLFSWRIGQAQAYHGAAITSTNTDGLYSVLEEELNNRILEQESATIGVEIEPEPLFLISKDTNNRLELTSDASVITAASGGTLACRKGPNPTKSLAHPAIIDWALSEYLTITAQGYKGLSLDQPFNETIGMNILKSAIYKHDPIQWMRLFQNIIASSPGSIRYIYGIQENEPNKPIILQHYNRVFYMKPNTPDTMHLWAAFARVIPAKTQAKREKDNQPRRELQATASHVMRENGLADIPKDKDIVTVKVSNVDPEWNIAIENRDLRDLPVSEFHQLLENLDYNCYLTLLKDSYENNWRNHLPNRQYIQFMDVLDNTQESVHTQTASLRHHEPLRTEWCPQPLHEKFMEWNTKADGTGDTILPGVSFNDDTTVYAIYKV